MKTGQKRYRSGRGPLRDGAWFAPKRYGYGAGWPLTWQGWGVLGLYVLTLVILIIIARRSLPLAQAGIFLLIILATSLLMIIARKRTRGGWRWRWGERG